MREPIAIACSGLGHIRRGNETWARDVAVALHQSGVPVTLFGGGPEPEAECPYVRLLNVRRDFPVLRRWLPWPKRYLAEQLSFLFALRRRLLGGGWRVVHLCDPDLALQMHRRTVGTQLRVAFKDGMRLGPQWCRRLDFVQVLAPYYRDVLAREAGVNTEGWFVIPHLVDTDRFHPPANRAVARAALAELELPAEAFVVLGVGDFSAGGNKRLEWLVEEVGQLPSQLQTYLVLVGQADREEFERFEAMARQRLGHRIRLRRNLPRDQVMLLYQAADVFAHAALTEPFGIVFLEAMSSGLPLAGHPWEVTRWIIGDAGETVDMTAPGALAQVLRGWALDPGARQVVARRSRNRALSQFAPAKLVPLYESMYRQMLAQGRPR